MLQTTGRPTTATDTVSPFPRLIAPETYWFSTCLPFEANGREVHNHNSCFLVCGDRATMLVDTGLPFQWAELKEQLLAVLDGRPLTYVFATHPEAPHMGNAGPLLMLFPGAELIGDLRNYKLYLPKLTHRFSPKKPGDVIDLGGRQLTMVPAVVHDLRNTLWAYEMPHRILFVSDGYPYTHQHEADQCAMTSEELPAPPLPEDTGPVIEGALGWTRHVPAELVIRDIEALLERYPPALIAPAHGGVVTNPTAMTELFKAGLRRISGAPNSMSRVEQIADDVYVLSDVEPADSERSWLPADAKGFEPFNKYVIVKPDAVLLLETGVAAHCESVMATLRDIVGDRMLVLLPTRSELESIGNMGAILDAFPRVQLLTTTRALPPLGLCHIREDKRDSIPARRIRRGESLDGVGFGNLQTLNPVIRILNTIWIYDRDLRMLFCSDFFANDLMETADQSVVRRSTAGLPDPATLRRSIVAKFDWLERAETTALRKQWYDMFRDIRPITLSPSLGRLQDGPELVSQVMDLYYRAVFETPDAGALDLREAAAFEAVDSR